MIIEFVGCFAASFTIILSLAALACFWENGFG